MKKLLNITGSALMFATIFWIRFNYDIKLKYVILFIIGYIISVITIILIDHQVDKLDGYINVMKQIYKPNMYKISYDIDNSKIITDISETDIEFNKEVFTDIEKQKLFDSMSKLVSESTLLSTGFYGNYSMNWILPNNEENISILETILTETSMVYFIDYVIDCVNDINVLDITKIVFLFIGCSTDNYELLVDFDENECRHYAKIINKTI